MQKKNKKIDEFALYLLYNLLNILNKLNLGKAHKVTSSASDTFIFGGEGDKEKLENKKNELKKELSKITKEFRRKIFLDRVGRLSGH